MVCRFESGSSPSTVRTGSRRPAANNFLRLKDRQLGLGGTERRHEMSLPVLFFPSPSFHFTFLSFTLSSFHFTLPSSIYVCISLFLHRPLFPSSSRLFLFLSLFLSSFSTRLMENPRWSFGGRKEGKGKIVALFFLFREERETDTAVHDSDYRGKRTKDQVVRVMRQRVFERKDIIKLWRERRREEEEEDSLEDLLEKSLQLLHVIRIRVRAWNHDI